MKGIVFTEFMEFIEAQFSLKIVETMIAKSNLPNAGVYTSVGTYNHEDMLLFVKILNEETKIPVADLVRSFGFYLFGQLEKNYPAFFQIPKNAFEFLESVHDHIHVEVKKLYKDAELPNFSHNHANKEKFILDYKSTRPLADLAEGMIKACIEHFKENIEVQRVDDQAEPGKIARFILIKHDK
jgi:hypothetical protein